MRPPFMRLVTTSSAAFRRSTIPAATPIRMPLHTTTASAPAAARAPAPWLQKLLADQSEPPRLYAWTSANLPGGGGGGNSQAAATKPAPLTPEEDASRRIYILGIGNIGRLYAVTLARRSRDHHHHHHQQQQELAHRPPPITLIVHRRSLLEHWAADPGIELTTPSLGANHSEKIVNEAFEVEWWTEEKPEMGPVREPGSYPFCFSAEGREAAAAAAAAEEEEEGKYGGGKIRNLIVTTKASDALPQVDRLRRYLDTATSTEGAKATVAFAQNGMSKMWPPLGEAYVEGRFGGKGNGGSRSPNWLACVTTHGVTSLGPFRSVHASPAHVVVGPVMLNKNGRSSSNQSQSSGDKGVESTSSPAEYLISQLTSAPGLEARRISRRDLWISQLEKLVVNAIMNPLTAVLRCVNGEVFVDRGDDMPGVIDALLREASETLRALVADASSEEILLSGGELERGEDNIDTALKAMRAELSERFAFERLRKFVHGIGETVAENTSSMLQDVRAGKGTEVRDFNGWLVDTARYLNGKRKEAGEEPLRLPAHEKLIELVEERAELTREEMGQHFQEVI